MSVVLGAIFAPAADAAAPIACFTQSPANPVVGQAVTFDSTCSRDPDSGGRISSRDWDLDNDGSFDDGTGVTATRTFTARGTFTVRLRVRDNSNQTDTETRTVAVNAAPTANFTNTPSAPQTGELVTFNSTSSDVDGTIASYAWALDADGAFNDGTTASASRTFTTPGNYTVKLRVTDNLGAESISTRTIAVANRGPAASFTNSPLAPSTADTVTFTSNSTDPDGTIASYAWALDADGTFNDGTTSSVSRGFTTPGDYTVKLKVTDDKGAENISTRTITVANRGPTASFTNDPAAPTTGQAITFTSTSTDPDGTIASYAWDTDGDATEDFDDGTAATATRTFARGNYVIRLKVTDNSGSSSISARTISVGNRPPVPSFTQSLSAPQTGEPLTFTSTSTDPDGTIAAYAWAVDSDGEFNDGTGATLTRTFNFPGTRTIKLKVTDNDGAETVVSKTVTIGNRPPVAAFDMTPAAPLTGDEVTFSSTSTDSDGRIVSTEWALDADGVFNDGTGATVKRTYTEPGTYQVKLRVRDSDGTDDDSTETTLTRTITVSNRLPTAAISFAPAAPLVGQEVTLTSSSADADGTVARQDWDLDGDGDFADDATEGATAKVRFATGGLHVVGLRVTDDRGGATTATQTIDVKAPVQAPRSDTPARPGQTFDTSTPVGSVPPVVPVVDPVVQPVAPLRWLDPFPTVRVRGRTTRTGVRLSLFSVRGPADSIVTLRCKGRSCPAKSLKAKIKGRKGAATGTARIRRIERSLRRGTILQVYVAKPGLVGKYTKFTIRSIALPIRKDRCLMPDSTRPVRCPAAP